MPGALQGLDFYGIYIDAWIVLDGQEYPLWIGGGPTTAIPGGPRKQTLVDPAWVTDVSIVLALGNNSKVDVTLSPPFDQGLALINSDLLRWGDGQLLVKIGYTTGQGMTQSYVFGGLIQKPDVKIGTDISVTLHSLGIGWALNLNTSMDPKDKKYENQWEGKSPAYVVKNILEKYKDRIDLKDLYSGIPVEQKGTVVSGELAYCQGSTPFFKPPTKPNLGRDGKEIQPPISLVITQGIKTDWWLVTDLLKIAGLDFLVTGDGEGGRQRIRVMNPDKWRQGDPTMTFILRGAIDSGARKFPILEFASPSDFVWLSPGMGAMYAKDVQIDKSVKELKVEPAKKKSEEKKDTSDGKGKKGVEQEKHEVPLSERLYDTDYHGAAGAPLSVGASFPSDASQESAERIKAELKNLYYSKGVNISVTTVGIPELTPGQVVNVFGIGRSIGDEDELGDGKTKFDGKYGILQVEHKIGSGGFTTSFKGVNSFYPKWARGGTEGKSPDPAGLTTGSGYGIQGPPRP